MLATERILEIATPGTALAVEKGVLRIRRQGEEVGAVATADVAAVVVAHPAVSLSHGVLHALADAGAVLVACDERFLPVAMLLPLQAHHLQAERMALQIEAPKPRRNRIWQQLVRAKLCNQGRVLAELYDDDAGLTQLARRVVSGDRTNLEAQAAQRYWPRLFGDPSFRRDRLREDQNRLLNYGYAVLRSLVARAICGAGLHPSIGVHHRNRYDAFRLADDLMEPLRPAVDRVVAAVVAVHGPQMQMSPAIKNQLVEGVMGRVRLGGQERTLTDATARMVASLVRVLGGQARTLEIPEV